MALTNQAHRIIRQHFSDSDLLSLELAVDATCGNGHDTVFLAKLGFKTIYAFDVQAEALKVTQQHLEEADVKPINLVLSGHENFAKHIKYPVDCFMFNLGYLPSADKKITTKKTTTLTALNICLDLLVENGLISVLCYPGHPEGLIETQAVKTWLENLNDSWLVKTVQSTSANQCTPVLFLIQRV